MSSEGPIPNSIAHFAINADDVERARGFYERVFGWRTTPWGPPRFYQFATPDGTLRGALQGRRELIPGTRMVGFECTVAVADLGATLQAVEAAGGRIVMPPVTIPTVGDLAFFEDSEGNVVGAMRYDAR